MGLSSLPKQLSPRYDGRDREVRYRRPVSPDSAPRGWGAGGDWRELDWTGSSWGGFGADDREPLQRRRPATTGKKKSKGQKRRARGRDFKKQRQGRRKGKEQK